MAFSELSHLPGGRAVVHAGLFDAGGGCPGHQHLVSEVPSQTCCPYELPVHHASGRGKTGALGQASFPGSRLSLLCESVLRSLCDPVMPAALSTPVDRWYRPTLIASGSSLDHRCASLALKA